MKFVYHRPPGLVVIVLYKFIVALALFLTAIAIFVAAQNYQALELFAESYTLEGKLAIIDWSLKKLLKLNPRTLQFSGLAMAGYATVTLIEAIGLWFEQTWAKVLVIGLVGISLPPEIYEIVREISLPKVGLLAVNAAVFWYLVHHLNKEANKENPSSLT